MALNFESQSIVQGQLDSGEELLWWNRPAPFAFARNGAFPGLIVGLLFAGYPVVSLFQMHKGGFDNSKMQFSFFLILFLMPGVLAILRPMWKYFEARSLVYFLTDRRAGKIFRFPRFRVWSLEARDFGPVEKEILTGGLGNVVFTIRIKNGEDGQYVSKEGFMAIADYDAVEQQLRRLKAAEA